MTGFRTIMTLLLAMGLAFSFSISQADYSEEDNRILASADEGEDMSMDEGDMSSDGEEMAAKAEAKAEKKAAKAKKKMKKKKRKMRKKARKAKKKMKEKMEH